MPVDYTIAARNAQATAAPDFANMLAQYQMMGARAQQNQLAQMQMAEYARKAQAEQALRGLSPNFDDPRFAQQVFQYDPDFARNLYLAQLRGRGEQASTRYTEEQIATERGLRPLKEIEAQAKGRKATSEATGQELEAARRLITPAVMARDPETMSARYAEIYQDLPPIAQKRLGARPDMQALEAFMETPEERLQARKPIAGMKAGELVVTPTGRFGEPPVAVEPQYMPPANVLAPQKGVNNMGRLVTDMGPQQIDPIIQKQIMRDEQLKQLPPGPIREKVSARMDIGDNLNVLDEQLTGLAEAGGIPRAGATSSENWKAAFRKSKTGQALGNLSDSEVNARLAALRTAATVLKAQLRKGLEMGVTQMDAVKESEKLDQALLNPDSIKGLSQGYASIDVLKRLLGGGAPTAQTMPRGKAGEAPKSNVGDFFK